MPENKTEMENEAEPKASVSDGPSPRPKGLSSATREWINDFMRAGSRDWNRKEGDHE